MGQYDKREQVYPLIFAKMAKNDLKG